jgi:hypothetical protein
MDNKELEGLLEARFASASRPVDSPSLAPEIMARVAAGADTQPQDEQSSLGGGASHDWVLAFAWLLGALVCIPSLQGLDVQSLLSLLPLEIFGAYAQTATMLVLPLLGVLALLPMAWLVLED